MTETLDISISGITALKSGAPLHRHGIENAVSGVQKAQVLFIKLSHASLPHTTVRLLLWEAKSLVLAQGFPSDTEIISGSQRVCQPHDKINF